eukprot:CAMPEP_0185598452 /NCGR_PEP_ID=MMETSP0434-20130131/82003_1 /TAXON_ID=626734 ORGANISM="Favella taraikaensis, Strain Fe Narragansett Bay" /NCGR_SAMPLE_ID=MMETSP0434 /ASSEMBLY_ACC=CAM_ASM_000379 /LENGTH=74 /DNA_ID=CAMNT_0028227435 /DNA_START=2004 /DNA_END=2228 /DNA_ORIENTATION=-
MKQEKENLERSFSTRERMGKHDQNVLSESQLIKKEDLASQQDQGGDKAEAEAEEQDFDFDLGVETHQPEEAADE